MVEGLTLLQLRILMCFLNAGPEGCSNSSLNKTLGIEKYTLSRVVMDMERMGLVDRTNIRRPVLTEMGQREAEYYAERMDIAQRRRDRPAQRRHRGRQELLSGGHRLL